VCFYFSKLLNFIKKDVASNDLLSENILSSYCISTSEATWRSEVVAFFFADIWLNCNVLTNVSISYLLFFLLYYYNFYYSIFIIYTILKYSKLA